MSTEPFIGEIKLFGFSFAPKMYATCSGQILSIANNTALFSLLGTTYGGNGQTTFGLPDLRGRVAVGQGSGPGLPSYSMGEASGYTSVTLTSANMPAHVHTLNAATVRMPVNNTLADIGEPAGAFPGTNNTNQVYAENPTPGQFSARATVGGSTDIAGSGYPFSIMNPYLVINYCIAQYGIFPSRN